MSLDPNRLPMAVFTPHQDAALTAASNWYKAELLAFPDGGGRSDMPLPCSSFTSATEPRFPFTSPCTTDSQSPLAIPR